MKVKLDVKAMSVNRAWQGRRFKTTDYKDYERLLINELPDLDDYFNFEQPLHLTVIFGLSNMASDVDNGLKPFIDVMQKKYEFDDKFIFGMEIDKHLVARGHEYIFFEILPYQAIRKKMIEDITGVQGRELPCTDSQTEK